MIKVAIFDLDGTLLDSDPYWEIADRLFAKEYGFPLTDEFRKQLSGLGIRESAELFIKTYKLNETVDSFMTLRMKYLYKVLLENLHLMPYAKEIIVKLKNKGFILAIVTAGHGLQITNEILNKLSIMEYFNYVISGLEVKHSKPAPDVYLFAIQKMGRSPNECIIVEDTVNGVLSGKAAGMKVIGINNNIQTKDRLKNAGADYVFSDLNLPNEILA